MKIAVSQRHDFSVERDEWRDVLDSSWSRLLFEAGMFTYPVPNSIGDAGVYLQSLKPDAILLSGGGNVGETIQRQNIEQTLTRYALERGLPVLGVCRGFQFLNYYFGGSLSEVSGHVGATHPISGNLFRGKERTVNSFHSSAIRVDGLGKGLRPVALAPDGTVEAALHSSLGWLGVMWHPERAGNDPDVGSALVERFFAGEINV